jgi:hypothetical protein
LEAFPVNASFGSGSYIGQHPFIPIDPITPFFYLPDPLITSLLRGCEVPNIDLDSMANPVVPGTSPSTSDHLACGPAAAANSIHWLVDKFDEMDLGDESIRETLDTLKRMMGLNATGGVSHVDFIRGKLEFVDWHRLPIRVKFQSHASADSVPSPIPIYGNYAKNHSPQPDEHITYDWLKGELEDDEDVELSYGYFCDTLFRLDTIVMNGDTTFVDSLGRVRKGGHYLDVTGYIQVGERRFITYKHDINVSGPGGTIDENGDPITDFSEWKEDTSGYQLLPNASTPNCVAYIETIVSESYDPAVEFCTKRGFFAILCGKCNFVQW